MATAADTKPPTTSLAGNDSFIAMPFALGFRMNPELARIVVTFWIAWKLEQGGKTLSQSESDQRWPYPTLARLP
jgi:hypothetical protein